MATRKTKIRRLTRGDLLALDQIDPTFTSNSHLAVEATETLDGLTVRFVERPVDSPFTKTEGYRYDSEQLEQTRYRLEAAQDSLLLVAEAEGRLVAVLEVEGEKWRNTALIWALFVDVAWRGQGLGAALLARAEAWARRKKYRALVLETQTNNMPAIRFYGHHGYHLAGYDRYFYTNQDVERREVAIFMYKPLDTD